MSRNWRSYLKAKVDRMALAQISNLRDSTTKHVVRRSAITGAAIMPCGNGRINRPSKAPVTLPRISFLREE